MDGLLWRETEMSYEDLRLAHMPFTIGHRGPAALGPLDERDARLVCLRQVTHRCIDLALESTATRYAGHLLLRFHNVHQQWQRRNDDGLVSEAPLDAFFIYIRGV